jgi:uncharacterized protein YfiM (DUF2279 family)
LIGILYFILQSGIPLCAEDRPENLKVYFQSFEKGKKMESQDRWLSPDKGYHVMGSMIGTTLVGQISLRGFGNSVEKSQAIGAGATFTLGFVKEIFDSNKPQNCFSWKDLTANGVGIIIGIILISIN